MKLNDIQKIEIEKSGLIRGRHNGEVFYVGKPDFIKRLHPSFTIEEFERVQNLSKAIQVKKRFSKYFGYMEILKG